MTGSSDKPRLLFICLGLSSFVKEDIKLLGEQYDVRVFVFDANRFSSKLGHLFGLIYYGLKQFLWLLRELPHARLVYGWFADYHVLLPVLMAKWFDRPSVIPLAGFDTMALPTLDYGVFHSSWRAPIARMVLRNASLLLPVSETMMKSTNEYSEYPRPSTNGVRHFVRDLLTPHEVLPFGYDPNKWRAGPEERNRSICTVGYVSRDRTLRRKGVDLLIEAARSLPDTTFRIVGIDEAAQAQIRTRYRPPNNVELLSPVPREELAAIYGQSTVYAQVSRAEGQPNVLCEAMCCGCIPVGSPVFGIPETIGETGYVVERPEPKHIAAVLEKALSEASPERHRAARERIASTYTLSRRGLRLHAIIDELLDQPTFR